MLVRAAIAVSLLASLIAAPAIALTRAACTDGSEPCPPSMRHAKTCSAYAIDCCDLRNDPPLAPALFERTASFIAVPAGPSLAASSSLYERPVIFAPLACVLAAGPPLFLKVRALLI
jgi:hypothetical protein